MRKIVFSIILIIIQAVAGRTGDINVPQQLTSTLGSEYDQCISFDGSRLLYTVDLAGDENIWLLNLKNKEKLQITRHTASDYSPCFLGRSKILFISRRANSLGDIYTCGFKGDDLQPLKAGIGYFDMPASSKNGKRVAYVRAEGAREVRIFSYNLRNGDILKGPKGISPEFSRSEDSIIYISSDEDEIARKMAIFSMADSSVTYLATGEGIDLNPTVMPDGRRILFDKISRDTDDDGKLTVSDDSDLMIYDIVDKTIIRIFPGFHFSDPTVSENDVLCARGKDGHIYLISSDGVSRRQPDYESQTALCDSLISSAQNTRDSLIAAAACYEAYFYYPENCRDLILKSCTLYSYLDEHYLALAILSEIAEEPDPVFLYSIKLTEAEIRYRVWKNRNDYRERIKAIDICNRLLDNKNATDSLGKEAYLFAIELYFNERMYDKGGGIIDSAMTRYESDGDFSAELERWKLRYLTYTYAGDIGDLVPLHVNLMEKYKLRGSVDAEVISDLMAMIRDKKPENSLEILENIRQNYNWNPLLSSAASLEQAKLLAGSNQRSLAEWRLNELLNNFPEMPSLRFSAFEELFEIYLNFQDFDKAVTMADSATAYLDYVNDRNIAGTFMMKAAELYTYLGYQNLNDDSGAAKSMFIKALSMDGGNSGALRGLAITGFDNKFEKEQSSINSTISPSRLKCLLAYSNILLYQKIGKSAQLSKARDYLIEAIELNSQDILPYISLGYVDCRMEEKSPVGLGLYEEGLEYSIRGLAYIGDNREFSFGIYLNIAEAYFGLNQFEDAFNFYRKALDIKPDLLNNIDFCKKLGESAFQVDSLAIAGNCFERNYTYSTDSGNEKEKAFSALKLGLVKQDQGDYIEAADYYQAALPYYIASKNRKTETDILKGQAFCIKMSGDAAASRSFAADAARQFEQARYKGKTYDNRVKLILWPFGFKIPLMELLPMRFGGSLYPVGFTSAATDAFIMELSEGEESAISEIALKKAQINALNESKEEENSIDLWHRLGMVYGKIEYADSSISSFAKAYKLSMDLEDYHSAYIELLNRAEVIFSDFPPPEFAGRLKDLKELEDKALDLYDYILPSYPEARANLKNIAGLSEYVMGVIEAGNKDIDKSSTITGLFSDLDKRAQDATTRFSRAGYYFKEALVGLTPGLYSSLEAALLLNDAVASLTLGDLDGFGSSVERARKASINAESPALYAMINGIKAVTRLDPDPQDIASLQEALGILEDMTVAGENIADAGFMSLLYDRLIAYKLNTGDNYGAIRNLEASKMLSRISTSTPFSSAFYKSDNFRANLDLLRQYQSGILELESRERKLSSAGGTGSISLKSVSDEVLDKRGRFLEIKQDLKEMDPVVYSSLILDVPSIVGMLKLIPKDEICIIPYKMNNKYSIWICNNDTIKYLAGPNIEELVSDKRLISDYDCRVITVASLDSTGDEIALAINHRYPHILVKRSPSLSDAYKGGISDIRGTDGVIIVRSERNTLSDLFANELGAVVIKCDSTTAHTDFSGYGWLVLDGRIYRDNENGLLSYWKTAGEGLNEGTTAGLYLKDLPKLKNDAFGIIILNSGDKLRGEEKAILIKAAENSGVSSIIECELSSNQENVEDRLRDYFNGLKVKSPIESFNDAFAGSKGITAVYYGDRGWRENTEESEFKKVFSQYLIAGNQYFLNKNWNVAARYYNSAIEIAKRSNIRMRGLGQAVINLLECLRQTDRYDINLLRNFREYVTILEDGGDTLKAAYLYSDAANIEYENGNYRKAIEFAGDLIEKSKGIVIDSLQAIGYAIRGRAEFQTGETEQAEDDLNKATGLYPGSKDDFELISLKLNLAAIYNSTEMWGKSRLILDSLKGYFGKMSINKDVCAEFSVEDSKYHIGTLRNAIAKRELEDVEGMGVSSPQAKLLLAEIYLMRGQMDSAMIAALRAGKTAGRRSAALFNKDYHELLGDIYRLEGLQAEAIIQYNLAKEVIAGFRNREPVDILDYKLIITDDTTGADHVSLLMQLLNSGSGRIKDLCRYQLAQRVLQKGDRSQADSLLDAIINSVDDFSIKYLKWRAYYNKGLISDGAEKSQYFEKANEILMKLPGESDYIRRYYGFNESGSDLYNSLADMEISSAKIDLAVDFMERGFAQRIAGKYFAIGEFDSTENGILNLLFSDGGQISEKDDETAEIVKIKSNEVYSILWGGEGREVSTLQPNLNDGEGILRFYEGNDGYMIAWIDRDTIAIREYPIAESDLMKAVEKMGDILSNQNRADSAMEKWYADFISPFESLISDKEKLLIIPDGPLYFFPFEALKMPDGDYLSEMYSLSRQAFLPSEYPSEISSPAYPVLSVEPGLGSGLRLIDYIAEPLTRLPGDENGAVVFYSGEFTIFSETPIINNRILCEVESLPVQGYEKLQLQSIMAAKTGERGYVYPLWKLPDDVRSAYYWKFLTRLANGTGYWKSNNSARSFIYGHYDGLPYFWAGNVYINLN